MLGRLRGHNESATSRGTEAYYKLALEYASELDPGVYYFLIQEAVKLIEVEVGPFKRFVKWVSGLMRKIMGGKG